MAMEASFINYALPCCLNPIKQQFGYLLKLQKHVEDLSTAKSRLEAKKKDIQQKIAGGERNQEACTHEAADWMSRANDLEQKAEKIRQKYNERICSLNFWSSYRIGKKASKMLKKVDDLIQEETSLTVTMKAAPASCQEMPRPSSPCGMKSYLEQALGYLSDDGVRIVGIWGMGGVGKTTLLKEINNAFRPGGDRSNEFDYVIWVVASKEFSSTKFQKRIAERLHLELPDDPDSYSQTIFDFLRNKSFLLLVDDLWMHIDLHDLGIPNPLDTDGGTKRKWVLTARNESVCTGMGASETTIRVNCLEWNDAWRLFQKNVGSSIINSDSRIRLLAEQVAQKCRNLPLALITIGRAMSTKRTKEDWQYAVRLLKHSRIREVPGVDDENKELLNILKMSYDNLPSEEIKMCFLLCSLWPEDYSFHRSELIQCWMGIGVINDCEDFEHRRLKYNSFINMLKEAALLEPDLDEDRQVKMHDIIRDLALWIAKESEGMWIGQPGFGLREVLKASKEKQVKVISLIENDIRELPEQLPVCMNLSILMLQRNIFLQAIPANILQSFNALIYLDLSDTRIQELPATISALRKLQYLNLSFTYIASLPMELKDLVSLKYLHLRYTFNLSMIPSRVLSSLGELEVLNLYRSNYTNWEVMDGAGNNRASIEELEENQNLNSLGISIRTVSTLNKLFRLSHVSTLQLLISNLSYHNFAPLVQLTPQIIPQHVCDSLQQLEVDEVSGLRQLSLEKSDGQSWCLGKLEILDFDHLRDLEEIIWKGVVAHEFLPNLRLLFINDCPKLKNASRILHLPRLEQVDISCCDELTHVIDDSEDGRGEIELVESVSTFPRLKTIGLSELPNLRSIAGRALAFPSLESVSISNCDMLKKLPFQSQITESLRMIEGSKDWWEGLEWENDSLRSSVLPCFKELPYSVTRLFSGTSFRRHDDLRAPSVGRPSVNL